MEGVMALHPPALSASRYGPGASAACSPQSVPALRQADRTGRHHHAQQHRPQRRDRFRCGRAHPAGPEYAAGKRRIAAPYPVPRTARARAAGGSPSSRSRSGSLPGFPDRHTNTSTALSADQWEPLGDIHICESLAFSFSMDIMIMIVKFRKAQNPVPAPNDVLESLTQGIGGRHGTFAHSRSSDSRG